MQYCRKLANDDGIAVVGLEIPTGSDLSGLNESYFIIEYIYTLQQIKVK